MPSAWPRPPPGSTTPARPGKRGSTGWSAFSGNRKPTRTPFRKAKTMSNDPLATWALEREIVLSRVIAAPAARVFEAFTDPSQITRWFGPEGFTTETLEIDIREGGRWRFVYTGPDGTRWENRMLFLRVEAPR